MALRNHTHHVAGASLGQAEEIAATQESGTMRPGPSQDSDPEDFQDLEETIQAQIQGMRQNQDHTDQVLL